MPDNVLRFPTQPRPAFNAILDAFAEDLKPDLVEPIATESPPLIDDMIESEDAMLREIFGY